ncbi:hypothetical protein [Kitasatospora sp. NPDC004272]
MIDLICAALFAAIITGTAAATRTGARRIAQHLRDFPGTLVVGAGNGSFVALGVWALSLPFDVHQPPLRLAVDGCAWALLHVVLETAEHPARHR